MWGWGVRRQRLYQEKIRTLNTWKPSSAVTEIPIDPSCSYLRCSTPPPTESKTLLGFAVFFDDTLHKLSPIRVKRVMEHIRRKSIRPPMECSIIPMNVFFEFYSIGGLSKRLREEIYKNVIGPWEKEGISVFVNSSAFEDYRAFSIL